MRIPGCYVAFCPRLAFPSGAIGPFYLAGPTVPTVPATRHAQNSGKYGMLTDRNVGPFSRLGNAASTLAPQTKLNAR